ncbi:hypothetical protein GF338_04265 [candidate division WOR-3 bacterium]|nr:hypothetical protein [candidate division WOR-3 bacterium]
MKKGLPVNLSTLCIIALILSLTVTYLQQYENRKIVITCEGKSAGEIDITGWIPGDELIYFSKHSPRFETYSYYYPWQGEDSLDYRIEDGLLFVNGKVVGVYLQEILFTDLPNPELILSVYADSEDISKLKQLPNLVAVIMGKTDDNDLINLKDLTNLKLLSFDVKPEITDSGLAHLEGLANLRELNLNYADITNAGLTHLQNLMNLRKLNLMYTDITDAGLRHLAGLKNLKELWLTPNITESGIEELQKALPDCNISTALY